MRHLNRITVIYGIHLYYTFSRKSEHFTCKRPLGIGSKISQHDQKKNKVIEHTSCKNALIHSCLPFDSRQVEYNRKDFSKTVKHNF